MIQESEIINLILACIAILFLIFVFRKKELAELGHIYAGFSFLVCAYVFTVVEGLIWHDFFNLLEHLCYALSGVSFAFGFWKFSLQSESEEEAL